MDNLIKLLDKYTEDSRTKTITSHCEAPSPTRLMATGMVGAQDCFVLAAVYLQTNQSQIFIANDKEEAAYFQNSLDLILDNTKVHFFPDSFKRPMYYEEYNSTNVLERTEAINKINQSNSKAKILVTYPEALFEKVVDPKILDQKKIEIIKGEDLDVDTIIEILVEYGFERVEFVYEPGQFAIRGGIVDIFSFGNEWPYRIELFDEEIEGIRTFNPVDQLSVKNIGKVSIIPNINSGFKQEQKVSIFSVFDDNTTLWVRDLDLLIDKLQTCLDKVESFASNLSVVTDSELKKIFEERAFIYPKEIVSSIKRFNLIITKKSHIDLKVDETIDYNSKPQPSFNRNFKLLIDNLEENEKHGLDTFLFTDSVKQIERFYSIFEDLKSDVLIHPVKMVIYEGFVDVELNIACYTDHQIFDRFHRYKLKKGFTKDQALNLKLLREMRPGDFVTHIDHGVGKYSGLERLDINGRIQESVRLIYQNNDILYVGINSLHKISKYIGKEGKAPRLNKIGGDAWKSLKRKAKGKVKDIAKELIKLYAKRKASKGFAFPVDGYLQNELEASFIYEDTPDQLKATNDVKEDMMADSPMDRLICGDVGFGKTEIAIRGAFKAIVGGKQVAVLVPTTILALQHYKTFKDRFDEFGISVDYVNRFKTAKQKKETYARLLSGELDLIIGTHALLSKDVKFKDLGLLVIDEEQKFGVAAKEKLRNFKVNVDTLTLTATPIPRTLQFSLMAARDLSIIKTPPPNRQAIHTERRLFNDELIREAIYYEVNRGGQVFFVHNRVKSLIDMAAMVKRLCPDVSVLIAHGQLESKQLEERLMSFIDGKYDVLVCTNIIETGLDISNANTIIINNAHHFGLSDLHQLRGRVGRSNRKAYCYLFAPPLSVMTTDARKRLKTLEEFSDLGSGFHIAMRDLDIRGAGNMLGGEQSGFISDIGYDTFQKILEEAVIELKETEFKDLYKEQMQKEREYVRDVEVETDIEMLIPDEYINNIQERLLLYTQLDKIDKEEDLLKFVIGIKDRFGKIPNQIRELLDALRVRWICKKLGFERLSLKSNKLRCYFIRNPQSTFFETPLFQKILGYISDNGKQKGFYLKQSRNSLLVINDNVKNLRQARKLLEDIHSKVKTTKD
ncbi:MAG: transcription-repair coupling factor [Saprospiraceae bacterium]